MSANVPVPVDQQGMTPPQPDQGAAHTLDRRGFLGVVGGAGAALVLAACGDKGKAPNSMGTTTSTNPEVATPPTTQEIPAGYELAWGWDPSKPVEEQWNIATPELDVYNGEEQTYTANPENVRTEGNTLVLEAHRDEVGEITSGRVSTEGLFSFGIGSRVEASIKMPKGKGTWPAFWMLSANQPHTAKFNPDDAKWEEVITDDQGVDHEFYLHDGEIDVVEWYGKNPGEMEATVHTYDKSTEGTHPTPDASEEFHTYAGEIFADRVEFSMDGEVFHTEPKPVGADADAWPFTPDNGLSKKVTD